jgi:hypothetical protein
MKNTSLEWFSKFKSSVTSVEDAERLRCPSVSKMDENVDCVKEVILINKRSTICEVAKCWEFHLGQFREL